MKGSIIQDTKYQDNNFCISCHEGFHYLGGGNHYRTEVRVLGFVDLDEARLPPGQLVPRPRFKNKNNNEEEKKEQTYRILY